MANHYSALEHQRQSVRRELVNRRNKGFLRSSLRQIREILANGDIEQASKLVSQVNSRVDKAVSKKILHKNAASRLKSRLMARLNALGKAKAA
ncbi:MAG: 30S ribosomal protein S20 [Acidobacteria bacterium RIFCSPLOWO2_12_FULL_54_10]|nr:MAG: 30S ribosomal protein S20 [Acidobacteria bacterium RIFCSPLOWO2_12_FULL_54_10]